MWCGLPVGSGHSGGSGQSKRVGLGQPAEWGNPWAQGTRQPMGCGQPIRSGQPMWSGNPWGRGSLWGHSKGCGHSMGATVGQPTEQRNCGGGPRGRPGGRPTDRAATDPSAGRDAVARSGGWLGGRLCGPSGGDTKHVVIRDACGQRNDQRRSRGGWLIHNCTTPSATSHAGARAGSNAAEVLASGAHGPDSRLCALTRSPHNYRADRRKTTARRAPRASSEKALIRRCNGRGTMRRWTCTDGKVGLLGMEPLGVLHVETPAPT